MPKFRKKYVHGKSYRSDKAVGSDQRMLKEEKEDRGLRSSSLRYKDDIDSV
ncbi:MAG: hypothetical protein SPL80_02940 [Bacilli bacterium]|nr:hypothetical protein [Bacilli bacterium]